MSDVTIKIEISEGLRTVINTVLNAIADNFISPPATVSESNDTATHDNVVPIKTPAPAADPAQVFGQQPAAAAPAAAAPAGDTPPPPAAAPAAAPAGDTPPPPAAAPAAAAPAGDAVLDSAGNPYDARIHGSGKSFYADSDKQRGGQWKLKRGFNTDTPEVVAVLAELNAAGYGQPTAPATPPAGDVGAPAGPVIITTFPQLLSYITSEGFDEAQVQEACAAAGLESITLAATNPEAIPTIANELTL